MPQFIQTSFYCFPLYNHIIFLSSISSITCPLPSFLPPPSKSLPHIIYLFIHTPPSTFPPSSSETIYFWLSKQADGVMKEMKTLQRNQIHQFVCVCVCVCVCVFVCETTRVGNQEQEDEEEYMSHR